MADVVKLLPYLRSKTDIDLDSQELAIASKYGPFVDCTSNQADCYNEFLNPERSPLLKKSVALAQQFHGDYSSLTLEELAVEIAMISVMHTMAPFVSGTLHVMANPALSYSTTALIDNGERIVSLCRRMRPDFDHTRLCIKVPATWEGFQACRKLKSLGIRTLATTVFTMEQSMLAGEAGCSYIAPFVHELKALFDESYTEPGAPIFPVCVKAQAYFKHHNVPTKVLAAGLNSVEEVKKLAGVTHLTLPGPLVEELSGLEASEKELGTLSAFKDRLEDSDIPDVADYIRSEERWRAAFAQSDGGRGLEKTTQAIDIFCEYQTKAEELLRNIALGTA